jgi:hypothetical protein
MIQKSVSEIDKKKILNQDMYKYCNSDYRLGKLTQTSGETKIYKRNRREVCCFNPGS